MSKVENVCIRNIINSQGGFSIEADVELENKIFGRASSASAILPGRREQHTTQYLDNASYIYKDILPFFQGSFQSQNEWDGALERQMGQLGTDITLALSLAFARAAAKEKKLRLVEYIRDCKMMNRRNKDLIPLIPIFSGGVHDRSQGGSMQQIMLSVSGISFLDAINIILPFYSALERKLQKSSRFNGYAASSGFLFGHSQIEEEFEILTKAIEECGMTQHLSIAIDVAAEHLKERDMYRFYNRLYTADQMEDKLLKYTKDYPITYIEDPFDYSDINNWKSFHDNLKDDIDIFSDDLSATQIKYLDDKNVNGVVVKMKQVGTLSATLDLVNMAIQKHLKLCVSHRSIETEDTFMCDLGVAVGANYMKIGGPRRGDRVEKYNRLIRIFRSVDNF